MKVFTKTTQSVFATFTKDLEDIKDQQATKAEREAMVVEKALKRKDIAEAEVNAATNAIDGIMKMLKGE